MATGIWIRRSSGVSEGEVVVADNRVTGARLDPGGVGAEGHGIAVFRCQDVRITNNHCEGNGRGILVSNQSFGAVLQGNTCIDNNDVGIRCEPEISTRDVTVGIGARRGITVVGNVCRNNAAIGTPGGANSGVGISMSYAAGSTVSGNIVHSNTADGIFNDSGPGHDRRQRRLQQLDRATPPTRASGVAAASGSTPATAAPSSATSATTARPRRPSSTACRCPTPAPPTSCTPTTSRATRPGEVCGTDRVVAGFFGATPVTKRPNPGTATALNAPQVVNNLVQSLRELGLVT